MGEWVSLKVSSFANAMMVMRSLQGIGRRGDAFKWCYLALFSGSFDQPFILELSRLHTSLNELRLVLVLFLQETIKVFLRLRVRNQKTVILDLKLALGYLPEFLQRLASTRLMKVVISLSGG